MIMGANSLLREETVLQPLGSDISALNRSQYEYSVTMPAGNKPPAPSGTRSLMLIPVTSAVKLNVNPMKNFSKRHVSAPCPK
jgi:hypothetical protein